jgi:hypothetical protein
MSISLKRPGAVLAAVVCFTGDALASQGPGVGNGTATVGEQILLGTGLVAALVAYVMLARTGLR